MSLVRGLSRAALRGTRLSTSAASASTPASPLSSRLRLMTSVVDCSRVAVLPDKFGGHGAFATVDIPKGGLIESGLVRVLTDVDGDVNPYVLTWSDDVPNTTWAIGSGACTFYNTSSTGVEDCNTHMERDYENNTFVITATKDIKAGDELLHVYKGLGSRACFQDMDSAYEPIPL